MQWIEFEEHICISNYECPRRKEKHWLKSDIHFLIRLVLYNSVVSWHTCSLQNVSDECKNNNPSAKLETNTMKKCNRTKRSNLKHKNRTTHSTFYTVEYNVAIANSLAGSVSVCLRTRSGWMIIRNFSLSFSHFHFVVVDDWLVSDWRNFFLVPMRAQRSTSKMMCVFACNPRFCASVSLTWHGRWQKTKKWRLFHWKTRIFKE